VIVETCKEAGQAVGLSIGAIRFLQIAMGLLKSVRPIKGRRLVISIDNEGITIKSGRIRGPKTAPLAAASEADIRSVL